MSPIAFAGMAEEQLIRTMAHRYFVELAGIEGQPMPKVGAPKLNAYLSDPNRRPYLILAEDDDGEPEPAGFALVRLEATPREVIAVMSEFYVELSYRGRGLGKAAALAVFKEHPGPWRVSMGTRNLPALAFWRRITAQMLGEIPGAVPSGDTLTFRFAAPSVILEPVRELEKQDLRPMLEAYIGEFSARAGRGQSTAEAAPYQHFDLYWIEDHRHPYWILDRGERVGFVLTAEGRSHSGKPTDHSLVEFYITPEFRRQGRGATAAAACFRRHPGVWELHVDKANPDGLAFWPQALVTARARDVEMIEQPGHLIYRFLAG